MSGHGHDHGPLPSPTEATEVADGIYAYIQNDGTWWINNTGFMVGSRGVIAIDACATVARTEALLATIGRLSDQPVRTLINTHHHGDHTFGNFLFTGATIVGHSKMREAIAAFGTPRSAPVFTEVEWGAVELAPPFLTFDESVRVYVDDLECEVRYVGTPAHTTNDSIVWIPEHRVVFCGDLLFNGGTPFLVQGSIAGAREALQRLRELDAETIVPGHGPIATPALIESVDAYLAFVQDAAGQGHEAGLSPLEVGLSLDLGEFADLSDNERIVGNLHRAYAELDGKPLGSPLSIDTVFADMVEYNGGRPLTCLA